MYIDAQMLFSNSQRVCDGGATELSTNVVDLKNIRDLGAGQILYWHILSEEIPAGSGTTLTFNLVSDDNASLSSPSVIQSTGAIAKATLVAGYHLQIPVARGALSTVWQQYLGVQYVGDNTFASTGIMTSWIGIDAQDNIKYPDNITIS